MAIRTYEPLRKLMKHRTKELLENECVIRISIFDGKTTWCSTRSPDKVWDLVFGTDSFEVKKFALEEDEKGLQYVILLECKIETIAKEATIEILKDDSILYGRQLFMDYLLTPPGTLEIKFRLDWGEFT